MTTCILTVCVAGISISKIAIRDIDGAATC